MKDLRSDLSNLECAFYKAYLDADDATTKLNLNMITKCLNDIVATSDGTDINKIVRRIIDWSRDV